MNKGYAIILAGYVGWGLFPLYFMLLKHVPVLEVLLHRMLWAVPVLLLLVLLSERRRTQVKVAFGAWRELKWLTLSSLVITSNWAIYIWAVANQQAVEASMGYFLSPSMTTVGILFYVTPTLQFLCGVLVLGEAFNFDKLVGFICIWIGIAIFCYSFINRKELEAK